MAIKSDRKSGPETAIPEAEDELSDAEDEL